MKPVLYFLLFIHTLFLFNSCNQTADNKNSKSGLEYGQAKVEVFYFHRERRCPTCLTIEEFVQEFVKDEYAGKDLEYHSVDYENIENEDICSRYSIMKTTLLIASEDETEELTSFALEVIMSDPEQLRIKMRATIDSYMN